MASTTPDRSTPLFSVIIITWNQREKLDRCLASLEEHCDLSDGEIIILDNHSEDGTGEMLREKYSRFNLQFNEENRGVAPARNRGFRLAKGEYFILLDDDTEVRSDIFHVGVEYMEQHPEVGVLGPRLLLAEGEIQPSARLFPTVRAILGRGLPRLMPKSFSHHYLERFRTTTVPVQVDWVIGACQFIRRSTLKATGELDEGYFFGYEDVDFCFQVNKLGQKVVYHPDIVLTHYYQRRSSQKLFSKHRYHHIRSILRYFLKTGFRF